MRWSRDLLGLAASITGSSRTILPAFLKFVPRSVAAPSELCQPRGNAPLVGRGSFSEASLPARGAGAREWALALARPTTWAPEPCARKQVRGEVRCSQRASAVDRSRSRSKLRQFRWAPNSQLNRPSTKARRARWGASRKAQYAVSLGARRKVQLERRPGVGNRAPSTDFRWRLCVLLWVSSEKSWRRGRDSNPRYGFPYTHFPGVRLRPLGHPSSPIGRTGRGARYISGAKRASLG